MTHRSKRTVGTRRVELEDVRHIVVHRDEGMYLYAVNRGGIWNFGDGEIAVAYLALPMDYNVMRDGPNRAWSRHCGGPRSMWSHHPRWGGESGCIISRSFDHGETWPDEERQWLWHNDRSTDEIVDWLRPRPRAEREEIDLGEPDSIIHFCHGIYLKPPIGSVGSEGGDLGHPRHPPSFSLRSSNRGRTWESHATLIDAPPWAPDGGFLGSNLGCVRFDNGVLGIAGAHHWRHAMCFYVSYDNGISWEYCSEIARVSPHLAPTAPGVDKYGYTYSGVHRLPDGQLMCTMYQIPPEMPCVTFSDDDGMTWSPIRFFTGPGNHFGRMSDPEPERPLNDPRLANRWRCPSALVLRDGRILVLFARRTANLGNRGILGVVSDDLGETWSEEFVVRGDGYSYDLGYQMPTELPDGRIFVAYWFCAKDQDEPIEEVQVVRHIAGSFFRLP